MTPAQVLMIGFAEAGSYGSEGELDTKIDVILIGEDNNTLNGQVQAIIDPTDSAAEIGIAMRDAIVAWGVTQNYDVTKTILLQLQVI